MSILIQTVPENAKSYLKWEKCATLAWNVKKKRNTKEYKKKQWLMKLPKNCVSDIKEDKKNKK